MKPMIELRKGDIVVHRFHDWMGVVERVEGNFAYIILYGACENWQYFSHKMTRDYLIITDVFRI